jgi:hypothetical protein
MKSRFLVVGIALTVLLASCGPVKPTLTPPTVANAPVLPSATLTATALPTATSTPVPPTATATPPPTATQTARPTATATASLTPTASPTLPAFLLTQDSPPIPTGKGGLIVTNDFSQELGLEIGGKFYTIPGFGRMVIFLAPGRYTFSVAIPGLAGGSGIVQILENYYVPQEFYH